MQRIINQMKKTPYVDPQTGEYNLKFNMQNMLEDYFLPVRGGASGTEIDTLSGMEFTGIDDIEYLRNKMMAALKVPKAFLGYDEAITGKATLAAEDVRFARTIERIQRIVISELHKIAIVHLFAQGFTNEDLVSFELSMTSPSTIYEQEKITLYATKVDLAGSMIEKKLISREWIYKNIFNFTEEESDAINLDLIKNHQEAFRLKKIEEEGKDPADPKNQEPEEKEGEGGGGGDSAAPSANPFGESKDPNLEESEINLDLQKKYDKEADSKAKSERTPKGGWPGAGRPKEGIKYNTHEHPRGYDPIGKVAWKNSRNESAMDTIKKYGLSKLIVKSPKILTESNSSMLDESNIIPE